MSLHKPLDIFHRTKYLQPIIGDSRCALYSLANLLDDAGFLLFSGVVGMTDHEQECDILAKWAEASGSDINSIFFLAGIYGQGRLHLEDLSIPITKTTHGFVPLLVDFTRHNMDYAHTVGVLWPWGTDCVVLDPQKEKPIQLPKNYLFETVKVVGVRLIGKEVGKDFLVAEFEKKRNLSHIFLPLQDQQQPNTVEHDFA